MNAYLSSSDKRGIPPELLRSTPREAKLTSIGVVAWIFVVLLGLGGIVGGTLIYAASDHWSALKAEMRTSGSTAEGTVIGLRRTSGKNPQRLVSYRYMVGDRAYENRMRLGLRRTANLSFGSPVLVRYLPRDPKIGWLGGFEPGGVPIFLFPLTLFISGLLVFVLLLNLRKQRGLIIEGRPALATVTAVEKALEGDHRVIRVKYEFKIMSGAMRTGSSDVHRNPPAVGTTIVVLYGRDNQTQQARYPLSLYGLEGAAVLSRANYVSPQKSTLLIA
jgi:hypothetical protein